MQWSSVSPSAVFFPAVISLFSLNCSPFTTFFQQTFLASYVSSDSIPRLFQGPYLWIIQHSPVVLCLKYHMVDAGNPDAASLGPVVVAGGCGFFGSHVVNHVLNLESTYEVHIIDISTQYNQTYDVT